MATSITQKAQFTAPEANSRSMLESTLHEAL